MSPITIKQSEYTIFISKKSFFVEIEALLKSKFNKDYLEKCINAEFVQISQDKTSIAGESGEIELTEDNQAGIDLLARQKDLAQQSKRNYRRQVFMKRYYEKR